MVKALKRSVCAWLLAASTLAHAVQSPEARLPAGTAPSGEPGAPLDIVTRLPTREKVIVLSFDACQAGERMTLDHAITDLLVARAVPFTIFVGGRFARDNAAALKELATHPFVDLENHSWSHPRDLRALDDDRVRAEVTRAQAMIRATTGRKTRFFRFPGGNADERTVTLVRGLGYTVVHWRWPEGDPDPEVDAGRLIEQTLARTRAGDVLIFHVNGRGWHTAEALPGILDGLAGQGFHIVSLPDYLPR